ncbi:MAG: SdrD B-like domain-containing protein [Cyanobacteria bacterium J06627_28]
MSKRYHHLTHTTALCVGLTHRGTWVSLLTLLLFSGDVLTAGAAASALSSAPASFLSGDEILSGDETADEDIFAGERPLYLAMGVPGDYGDAPDTYGTDATSGNSANGTDPVGPHHTVVPGLHLGDNPPDSETDAQAPLDATGDGTDEDGVVFLSTLFTDNIVYSLAALDVTVTNSGTAPATLHAWLDFDGNGVFDADEYTSQTVPANTVGGGLTAALEWTGAGVSDMSAGITYARFRLTTDSTINSATPGGLAIDGEVEDYAVIIREPNTSNGGVCTAEYGLVYSGQVGNVFAVHVESGAALPLSTTALATVNGMATDHVGRLVYYADNNSIFAWDPLTQQHSVIESNFTSFLSSVPAGFDLGSGGAAYFGGALYQGVDTGTFEIYRVEFVPSSNGRIVQSVTPIGISAFLNRSTANWGDFIIDNNGVILGQSNGSPQYWTYDLDSGVFTGLSPGQGTPNINFQIAKDGSGRLWALTINNTIVQMRVVGTRFETVGPFRSTGTHGSFDAGECVRGTSIVGDRVWEDNNGDGIQDPGEPDIPNVTVDLIWDLDGDGVIDPNEPVLATQVTNGNGYYEFNELIFGNYIVQVTDINGVLTNSTLTTSTSAFAVTMPGGTNTIDLVDFGYQPIVNDPEVLLVKRVTAINDNRAENVNDGTPLNAVINDGVANSPDDNANWPNSYLVGALDGGAVRSVSNLPADRVEYSIYFLSSGEAIAQNVWMCDRIPENTTFVPDAYASAPPPDPAGSPTALLGIVFDSNGIEQSLTGANDGDRGYYFPPGTDPTALFPEVSCNGPNDNGAVVVNLGDIPQSTGVATPGDAFGVIRFQVRID